MRVFWCLLLTGAAALAQTPAPAGSETGERKVDRASAYYHFTLGHLYAELAAAYGNRGEYLNQAIENYKLAMKADPAAAFLSEELSDLYIQAGQTRTAVLEAEEALRRNPNDLTARRILGRIYARLIGDTRTNRVNDEMLRKAIEQYAAIAERDAKDLDTWLTLGRLQSVARNSVDAEKAFKKALEIDAGNEDALTGLARIYSELGDSKGAAEMLQRAAEKSPNLRTLTALALNYEQMREYALAAETLKQALEISAGANPDLKRALAQNLMLAERYEEALKVYEELVAEEPKDVQSFLRLSQIHRQQGRFEQARAAANKASELDPENLEVRYNEVGLLESEGKPAEAIELLKEMLAATEKKSYSAGERGNRVALLERLGVLERNSERYADAIATFGKIAALDTDLSGRMAAQIVETHRAAKDYAKAEAEANAAAAKYPDDRMLAMVRATVLAERGKAQEAVAALRKLLDGKADREIHLAIAQTWEKAKNYPEMGKALEAAEKLSQTDEEKEAVYFMRGAMYERMKRFDAAEKEFRKVLAINPRNASALNYLGYMFADQNMKLDEAHELIKKALELDPNNGAYLDSMGWVYYRQGRLEEAEQYLLRALQRYGRDPAIHDHLGDVYLKQGRVKEAIAQWQKALKEWEGSAPSENDPAEVAKIQKKLEGARVRLAKEASVPASKRQ